VNQNKTEAMEKNTALMNTQNSHQLNSNSVMNKMNSIFHSLSVGQMIKNFKLRKSLPLLKTTDFKVSQIAYIVGLDTEELIELFITKHGMTPLQYRQRHHIG
jgi:AraC-like DNA-binding protein